MSRRTQGYRSELPWPRPELSSGLVLTKDLLEVLTVHPKLLRPAIPLLSPILTNRNDPSLSGQLQKTLEEILLVSFRSIHKLQSLGLGQGAEASGGGGVHDLDHLVHGAVIVHLYRGVVLDVLKIWLPNYHDKFIETLYRMAPCGPVVKDEGILPGSPWLCMAAA